MVDPHRLRMFQAVVTQGSVHRAAELLGYTPSTVSQHLAALQKETGLSLLERRGRGLVPTAAGRQLAEAAGDVLGRLADLTALTRDLRDGRQGRLLLSYVGSAGVALVPPILPRLLDEFPDVRFDLRLNEAPTEHPLPPDLDLYVVQRSALPPADDGYRHQVLFDDPHLALVPRGHRWYDRSELRPVELADEPLIDNDVGRGPCRRAVLDLFRAVGAEPTFRIEAHDYSAALEFVATGVGVSIMPRLGIRRLPDGVRAIPIVDPVPYRTLMLRIRDGMRHHPVAVRTTELILEAAAAHTGAPSAAPLP